MCIRDSLTHPAGVDMHGTSTIEVLRHAPGVHLVALFAPEHGLRGEYPAGANSLDHVDARTGLMIHSLYHGTGTRPTRAQLAGIDAMVIDLQDIGVRSYTFVSAMKVCMEGCFENGVEVVVLDRPNPLGGQMCIRDSLHLAHKKALVARLADGDGLVGRHGGQGYAGSRAVQSKRPRGKTPCPASMCATDRRLPSIE